MTMTEKLNAHREIVAADNELFEDYLRDLRESINRTLDMYIRGEIGLADLKRTAEETYNELHD